MTTLVLLSGLPGAGKSSAARHLECAHGAAVLSSDALRKEIFGFEDLADAASDFVYSALSELMTARVEQHVPLIVVDTSCIERPGVRNPTIETIRRLVATGACHLIPIRLIAEQGVLERRVLDRSSGHESQERLDFRIRALRAFVELMAAQPKTLDWIEIDTTSRGIDEVAALVETVVNELRDVEGDLFCG